jgi:hypothetical protein
MKKRRELRTSGSLAEIRRLRGGGSWCYVQTAFEGLVAGLHVERFTAGGCGAVVTAELWREGQVWRGNKCGLQILQHLWDLIYHSGAYRVVFRNVMPCTALLPLWLHAGLLFGSTLKKEVTCSSETSVVSQKTTLFISVHRAFYWERMDCKSASHCVPKRFLLQRRSKQKVF